MVKKMNELEIKNSGKIVATKQNPNKKWVSVESLERWALEQGNYIYNKITQATSELVKELEGKEDE